MFALILVVDEDLTTVLNLFEVGWELWLGGKVVVCFVDMMVMFIYLVVMIVGCFEVIEVVDVVGILLRVVYVLGKGYLMALVLEAVVVSLVWF